MDGSREKQTPVPDKLLLERLREQAGLDQGDPATAPASRPATKTAAQKALAELMDAVAAGKDTPYIDLAARASHCLHRRGYFTAKDLPQLSRASHENLMDPTIQAALGRVIKRLLEQKVGLSGRELIDALSALPANAETLEESVSQYVQTTEYYQRFVAEWRKDTSDADAEPPTPLDALSELAGQAMGLGITILGPTEDELQIAMTVTSKPVATNGHWERRTGKILWSREIPSREEERKWRRRLPTVCYAAWSEPTAAFQVKHFGKLVLTDEDLAEYCLWYKSLTQKEAQVWDGFVAGLRPNEKLVAKLKAFSLSGKPPVEDEADYGRNAAELILQALGHKPQ